MDLQELNEDIMIQLHGVDYVDKSSDLSFKMLHKLVISHYLVHVQPTYSYKTLRNGNFTLSCTTAAYILLQFATETGKILLPCMTVTYTFKMLNSRFLFEEDLEK